jgi:hypothetical protein
MLPSPVIGVLGAVLTVSAAVAQGPNVEFTSAALAQELAGLTHPVSGDDTTTKAMAAGWRGQIMRAMAFSGSSFGIDDQRLKVSLAKIARQETARRHEEIVAGYLALPVDQLRELIAFYRSPEGQTVIAAHAAFDAKVSKALDDATPDADFAPYTPTEAERLLATSQAGQAMARALASPHEKVIDQLQKDAAALEADYCVRAACRAEQHTLFEVLRIGLAPERANNERTR